MRFLRTASTRRLLLTITSALIAIIAGAAIAVAATGSGPVPRPTTLAKAVHGALVGAANQPVSGVSADISFTDNLIDSSDFTGQGTDPLIEGGTGRLWWSEDGRLRIELQSGDGDAQIVIDQRSWWISDPAQNVVYEGTLPAGSDDSGASGSTATVPTVARIQSELSRLMGSLDLAGPAPTDVAGQSAYQVTVSPKTSAGLLGSVQLAWDAARGVPLRFDVFARGDSTPVLGLAATSITYGPVAASVFAIAPTAGARIVQLGDGSDLAHRGSPTHSGKGWWSYPPSAPALHRPASVDGLTLQRTRSIDIGGTPAAMLVYGTGLGAIAVLETTAKSGQAAASPTVGGLSLPTRTIDGETATILGTPLGTVLTVSDHGVAYTVIGSVTPASAESAATQVLTAG